MNLALFILIRYFNIILMSAFDSFQSVQWEDIQPPVHHTIGLGEEAVGTYVYSVSFVINRLCQAADTITFLENNRFNIRSHQQLISSGKPRRTSADDDGSFNSLLIIRFHDVAKKVKRK